MARVHPIQTNFTRGEISPRLIGQVDLSAYKNAAETVENMTVFPQGGATRRSGTRFVCEVKDSSKVTRLIPFEFNVEQSYILEFGDQYIRFYKDNGQIVESDVTITGITQANPAVVTASSHGYSNGDHVWINNVVGMTEVNGRRYTVANKTTNTFELSGVDSSSYTAYSSNGDGQKVYEIATPYTEAQVFDLRFAQSADVMYIVHPSHEPEKLSRTAHTTWTLADVDFGATGPYLDASTSSTTLTPASSAVGTGVNVTASATTGINGGDGWQTTDVGRILKFNSGEAKITARTSTTVVVVTITKAFASTAGTTGWQLGAWSDTTGFPSTVTFYEQRLFYGGSTDFPQTIWASQSGSFDNFDVGDSSAADAFIYTIATNKVNVIRFLSPAKDLIVGTAGGEFKVGRPLGEPLKPDNVNITQQTTYGSHTSQPIQIGADVLFVQKQRKKIRSFEFRFADDTYISPDLTLLSEHITDTGVVDVDWAQEPDQIYWAVRDDGTLLGMTYLKEQEVLGWHRHIIGGKAVNCTITLTDYANIQTGTKLKFTKSDGTEVTFTSTTGTAGTDEFKTETNNNTSATNLKNAINAHADFTATVASNVVTASETTPQSTGYLTVVSQDTVRLAKVNESQAKVKSVSTISESAEHQVWIIVERIVNGSTVRYVEYLDSTLNQDSALSGTVTGSSTKVTSLDHLEGQTVQILIDDAVYPKQIVSSGAVTIDLPSTFASKTIEVGLGYESTVKTLRVEAGSQVGTAQGSKKRYNEVIVRLYKTVGATINGDQIPFRSSADEMGEPIPAFTGDKRVTNLGWNREGQITIKQTQPLPMTILSVTGTLVTSD
jgi:hypothetical protein